VTVSGAAEGNGLHPNLTMRVGGHLRAAVLCRRSGVISVFACPAGVLLAHGFAKRAGILSRAALRRILRYVGLGFAAAQSNGGKKSVDPPGHDARLPASGGPNLP
jgi:hypothetical protein